MRRTHVSSTSVYCDVVLSSILRTKSKYEKQIIGCRKRESKEKENEQASTSKQSEESNKTTELIVCIVNCVYAFNMCNLLAFLLEIEEIMHNRIANTHWNWVSLFFFCSTFTFTPDCYVGSLFICIVYLEIIIEIEYQIFLENCIFSQWIGWSWCKHDSEITWRIEQPR